MNISSYVIEFTQAPDANSKGAAKKAAKKAEKAAKKAAAKAANKDGATADKTAAKGPVKKIQPKRVVISSKSKMRPMQISFNPNASLIERPVVALTVACLTNTINDYSIISDPHRYSGAALGLPSGNELAGDSAIARYIARKTGASSGESLLGTDFEVSAIIDSWIDYSNALSKFQKIRRVKAVCATLDRALKEKTYVVGHTMTLADVALFAAIGFPSQVSDAADVESIMGGASSPTIRWMNMMRSCPAIRQATQLAMGISNDFEPVFDASASVDPFVTGMKPLEGATIGNVVTRYVCFIFMYKLFTNNH
jgi:hypothetical protein